MPLQTMSYWNALMPRIVAWSSGSRAMKASWSKFGIENGLCEKSTRFSSSFHSYIGKSVIQQKANWSLSDKASSSPTRMRRLAGEPGRLASGPAEKNTASPP